MNPPASAQVSAIVISGITIQLAEPLKNSLHIKISVDGVKLHSLQWERDEKPVGDYPLPESFTLRDGSVLSVKVKEKYLIYRDKTLAQFRHSVQEIWSAQEPNTPDAYARKYPIRLLDPRQQLWLNISVVSPLDTQTLEVAENVPRAPEQAPDLHAASRDAVQKLRDFKTAVDRLGWARHPVEIALNVGRAVSELSPVAKVVLGCVKVVYDQIKAHDQGHKEILALAESLVRIVHHIQPVKDIAELNELKKTLETFPDLMQETANLIETFVNQNGLVNFILTPYNRDKINNLKERHIVFEKEFDRGIKIDGAVKINSLVDLQALNVIKDCLLQGIKLVDPLAIECFSGTRADILTEVDTKTDDPNGSNIIWIHGAPGCGKSSISLTARTRLRGQGRLVTYFRFDRNQSSTTTSTVLWRLVAYDLARRLPPVRTRLLQQIIEDTIDLDSAIPMFALVEASLLEINDPPTEHPLVIIIDALDECGGFTGRLSEDRKMLLQTLWTDEGDITRVLSSISTPIVIPSGHLLTENPLNNASITASKDICTFLKSRFRDIQNDGLPDWPGEDVIANMAHRAAGNFMWATAAFEFIDSGLDQKERLERVMSDTPESKIMEPLYALYCTILETTFGKIADDSWEAEALRAVLGTVILARRPFSDHEFTKLPTSKPMDMDIITLIRDRLHSVLDQGLTLRFIHKSFDDFLLSGECPPKFAIHQDESQRLLTRLCITTMTAELRFNICGLETSCLRNGDILDIESKVMDGISPLLSYSCCFWAYHLVYTPFCERLMGDIEEMIFDKLLYWFEAMSLLKSINRVAYFLLIVLHWSRAAPDSVFKDFVRDAHRFIRAFGRPIAQSAPHVYISALPFAPECSSVAQRFLPRFPQILGLSTGKPTDWSSCAFTWEEYPAIPITNIAFSPDEKYFVVEVDSIIYICDSETGNQISTSFQVTSTGWVKSFIFDPIGRHIWLRCRSRNGKIIGWDIGGTHASFQDENDPSGAITCGPGADKISITFKSGTLTLRSADSGEHRHNVFERPRNSESALISVSLDGKYMAWAGHGDTTIRFWNMAHGSEIHSSRLHPHSGHTTTVSALSFSVDGHFAVSGSNDGTILIWDAKTGDAFGQPLATNVPVSAAAYSHENRVLVSASGVHGVMMVWNTTTHEVLHGPIESYTSTITVIALSRNSRRALSGSKDGTVRMWDLERKGIAPVANVIEGHREWIGCFALHGKRLASLDNSTIRVWDVSTGEPLLKPIATHSRYYKIIYSPDGSLIVAFNQGSIQAWNANTGEPTFNHDMGDGFQFDEVAFRSSDQCLLTCSGYGGVVRIWTLKNGSLTEDLSASSPQPTVPTYPVTIIALSPDGLTAIVRDEKRNPCHYLWSTTTYQPVPLNFTDDDYLSTCSTWYSPSGRSFAALLWRGTRTLRVWNTVTGETAAGPLTPNISGKVMGLAFSPDDCHIAFFHRDSTEIWVWNAHTGCLASGPWRGHTSHISTLFFSSREKLVSGSMNGQIRIWDTTDLHGPPQASVGILHDGAHMEDGWAVDENGDLLFWVPKDHREGLVWPRNVAIMGGKAVGIQTRLDLTRFRYGESWAECFRAEM